MVVNLETELSSSITGANEATASQLTESAIRLADETLIQIDDVLSILVEYETENELLDIVRRMIAETGTVAGRNEEASPARGV